MDTSFFKKDDEIVRQAGNYAEHMALYRNPSLVIRKRVTTKLNRLLKKDSLSGYKDKIVKRIKYIEECIFESSISEVNSQSIAESVPSDEKALVESFSSPVAPIIKQVIEDRVLHNLVTLALRHYTEQGNSDSRHDVIEPLIDLLK